MTTEARFERQLPALLEDLYLGPSPDYRDEVLAAAVRTRQRPAWTFPGRWLPMLTSRHDRSRVGQAAVAAIGVVVAPRRAARRGAVVCRRFAATTVPPPFGPARNGLIAYTRMATSTSVDPDTGKTRAARHGPRRYDPLGTRASRRTAPDRVLPRRQVRPRLGCMFDIVCGGADGTGSTRINATPIQNAKRDFSGPDGRLIAGQRQRRVAGPARLFDADGNAGTRRPRMDVGVGRRSRSGRRLARRSCTCRKDARDRPVRHGRRWDRRRDPDRPATHPSAVARTCAMPRTRRRPVALLLPLMPTDSHPAVRDERGRHRPPTSRRRVGLWSRTDPSGRPMAPGSHSTDGTRRWPATGTYARRPIAGLTAAPVDRASHRHPRARSSNGRRTASRSCRCSGTLVEGLHWSPGATGRRPADSSRRLPTGARDSVPMVDRRRSRLAARSRAEQRGARPRRSPDKKEPRVVGPGVQGVCGLVAGRGFEPLTFGL